MRLRLPILALLSLLTAGVLPGSAVAPTQGLSASAAEEAGAGPLPGRKPPEDGAADAQGLLQRAILAMESHQSVSAKVRCRIDLFDKRQYIGSGSYQEQQSERGQLLRLELRIQLDDQMSTLLEVFDGRYLWTYQKLEGETLTRVDAGRIAQALKAKNQLPTSGKIGSWPGLGGLPKLLRGLNSSFVFDRVEQTAFSMADQADDRQLAVWKLHGTWTPEVLLKILPDQAEEIKAGKPANLDKLPPHLPDQVTVCLGKDDLFPYQIKYGRSLPKRFWNRDGAGSRPMVTMEFPEVTLNVPISPSQFVYKPGKLTPTDRTAAFLKGLNLK